MAPAVHIHTLVCMHNWLLQQTSWEPAFHTGTASLRLLPAPLHHVSLARMLTSKCDGVMNEQPVCVHNEGSQCLLTLFCS